jgi:hypothetical protein
LKNLEVGSESKQKQHSNMPQEKKIVNGGPKKYFPTKIDINTVRWDEIISHVLVGAALVTSVSCLAFVATTFTNIHKGNEATETGDATFLNVCMSCLHVVKDPYELSVHDPNIEIFTKRKENGVLQCCAESPQQLSAMLNVIVHGRNKQPALNSSTNLKPSTVSAHMRVPADRIIEIKETFDDKYKSVFRFDPVNKTREWKEHASRVVVLDKGLKILESGPYFVSCSVSYHQRHKLEQKKWFSYVHRLRPASVGNTGVLLQLVHTSCGDCTEDFKTVYTGGVFHLKAGDFIQVFQSEKDLLASAYVGLHRLGSNDG